MLENELNLLALKLNDSHPFFLKKSFYNLSEYTVRQTDRKSEYVAKLGLLGQGKYPNIFISYLKHIQNLDKNPLRGAVAGKQNQNRTCYVCDKLKITKVNN